ncbi:DUF2306 domain-containing protein [Dyadobacter subterraneus]|uniref:DUF2306 domain-containing protein n=1 Tax=Dyadobacter subterraneus TaxID=2773304 RepID=A0ABR9WFL2_9BACT|nr:DUF2306 domain-containing protein [Dyadobacter subterraneus]MBE9463711.1 DUF2306 domain-containing protein [Dyadobacter subterraneus]
MPQKSTSSLRNKILKTVLAILAVFIGLYPLFYFLQDNFGLLGSKNSALLTSMLWSSSFYTHITAGGLALLFGWVQFNQRIRIANPAMHRNLGKLYLFLALCSSVSGSYLALHAEGGVIAVTGFLCLAIVWFTSTIIGYTSIVNGRVIRHQRFMVYSYAACFAAVTLRIWLPLLIFIYGDFIKAYVVVAWLCWIPNILVAYMLTRNMKNSGNEFV